MNLLTLLEPLEPLLTLTQNTMFTGTYLLADVPIRITSLYDEVHRMCAPYATKQEPQITVTTTQQDIDEESRLSVQQRAQEGLPPCDFPPHYLETLCVYRQIATSLLPMGVLLMHGSVIAVDGQAYMFTALSGTGKSTHVRLWRQHFGSRAVMVNDDKPLLRIQPDGVTVYGTPWDGKHHLSTNIHVPLRAIVDLRRGEQNEIHPISLQEAFPILLQQSFRPDNPTQAIQALQLLSLLANQVSLFTLHCNMEPEAAIIASKAMLP